MTYLAENFWMYIFFGIVGLIIGILVGKAKERHKWVKRVYLKIHEFEQIKYADSINEANNISRIIHILKGLVK